MNIKSSIYCYLFNIIKYDFDYINTMDNFCSFADEVICVTIPTEDGSHRLLKELEPKFSNLKIYESKVSLDNNRFDGLLKTEALERTTNPIKIIADGDEWFPLSNKPKWDYLAEELLKSQSIDGFFVPVIDCFGAKDKIRANTSIGVKMRMHKDTVVRRGVLPRAELHNNLINTELSDTTEPLLRNNHLANFAHIINPMYLAPMFVDDLKNIAHCFHFGFLSLERRVRINNEFWEKAWKDRSGKENNTIRDKNILENTTTIHHNLLLE